MTDEAMVEAVARAICRSDGPSPDGLRPDGSPMWTFYQVDAIAAIRAVAPLLIEQCAEVATGWAKRLKKVDGCGPMVATAEDIAEGIRALLGTEA